MNQQKRIAKAVLDADAWINTAQISAATMIERCSISSYLSVLRSQGLTECRRNRAEVEHRARDRVALAAYIKANQPVATQTHRPGKLADVPRMPTLAEALLA